MPGIIDTPKRSQVLGALRWARYLESTNGQVYSKREIARVFDVHIDTIYRIDQDGHGRTRRSLFGKTRGRKRKLSDKDCAAIEELYDEHPEEAPDLPWVQQLMESSVDKEACSKTISRSMRETRGIYKRIGEVKGWTSPADRDQICAHCRTMLEQYDERDFLLFRYTDECRFGWKQQRIGRLHISRRKGERNEPRNIREAPPPEDEVHDDRVHTWGGVGLDFKSDLIRYYASNKNGKMSQRIYVDQILEPHVSRWLEEGRGWILFEDNDSGHGGRSGSNIVRSWKEDNELKYIFNAPRAPWLNIIENAWRAPDQAVHLNAWKVQTANELYEIAEESWSSEDSLPQKTINEWVLSARQRTKDTLENGGKAISRERLTKAQRSAQKEDGSFDRDQLEN
jgi:transposase